MNWLNQLSTRLGLLRAEVLVLCFVILFFLSGVAFKVFVGYRERSELIEKAQVQLFTGTESDSLLAAEEQLYEQSLTSVERVLQGRTKLNFNAATAEELEALPEIGALLADRLVRFRAYKGGKLRSLDELLEVKGITPERLSVLKTYLTVE
ncbi:MAG: ComEA family DNA-binding protein [Candidatus Thermochlorobacter sp.]